MTSCLIIGGGINGYLPAIQLAQAGFSVTLLDRHATGQESSWAGAGILSLLLPWQYGPAVNALAQRGRALWPAWAQRLRDEGEIDPEYRCCGMAVLADAHLEAAQHWCEANAEPVSELPTPLAYLGTQGSLWMPKVAQARNPRIMQALRSLALRLRVELREHTPALGLNTQGNRVTSISTPLGVLSADIVVVAAGAWTGGLLTELGEAPEIFPVRGQIILFKSTPGLLPAVVYRKGHYLVPRTDGLILAGSTLEEVGFEKTTTSQAKAELLEFAFGVLPALCKAEIVGHWAGLRPGSPGNIPTIGRHPSLENLYVNSGHFRYGVTMAPAASEHLLHQIRGTATLFDATAYAWRQSADAHGKAAI